MEPLWPVDSAFDTPEAASPPSASVCALVCTFTGYTFTRSGVALCLSFTQLVCCCMRSIWCLQGVLEPLAGVVRHGMSCWAQVGSC